MYIYARGYISICTHIQICVCMIWIVSMQLNSTPCPRIPFLVHKRHFAQDLEDGNGAPTLLLSTPGRSEQSLGGITTHPCCGLFPALMGQHETDFQLAQLLGHMSVSLHTVRQHHLQSYRHGVVRDPRRVQPTPTSTVQAHLLFLNT